MKLRGPRTWACGKVALHIPLCTRRNFSYSLLGQQLSDGIQQDIW
jgi:hypothetical protein